MTQNGTKKNGLNKLTLGPYPDSKKVYLKGLKFIFVENMFEVVDYSITNRKVPNSKIFKL